MAAGWIPKPTTGNKAVGPCAPDCHRWTLKHALLKVIPEGESHTDCASLREQAASPCRLCSNVIGFDVRMYADPENNHALVHAVCRDRRSPESGARPMNKKHTAAELQAILAQRAADGDAGANAVLWVQRRRAAGLTRQMTGAECVDPQRIAALYARFGR